MLKFVHAWSSIEEGDEQQSNRYGSGSPGLVVMGSDSHSKGRGFESRHRILDGHFSHIFVVKIVLFV